ncbi:flagellar basal body-associated FliL family protein [Pacificimonas aurantium]|nr:flagellar basal body-associated FliL family protein [Pacificimonas aurantium]
MFMGGDDAAAEEAEVAEVDEAADAEADETAEATVFVDVPPMVVNLRSADGQARFLKVHFVLVPTGAEHVPELEQQIPLLLDSYQPFLRELRPEDLSGAAAVYRIKEEMLVRALDTLGHGKVRDILIQDLVQQ